jgi:hypothetical protein
VPYEPHHTLPLFPRRQILPAGQLVHATDTYQTACYGRVLPGAQNMPDDASITCPGCTRGPRPRWIGYTRLSPDEIAWRAVVDAFDTEVRNDPQKMFKEFGYWPTDKALDADVRWKRGTAAFDALESGLLLGRHTRSVMRESGVLAVLAGAADPSVQTPPDPPAR